MNSFVHFFVLRLNWNPSSRNANVEIVVTATSSKYDVSIVSSADKRTAKTAISAIKSPEKKKASRINLGTKLLPSQT